MKYSEYVRISEKQKSKRVKEFVTLRRDNPEQLIQEIEDKFGFEYIE